MLLLLLGLLPVLLGLALLPVKDRLLREICAVAAACVQSGLVCWLLLSGYGEGLTLFSVTEDFVCALSLDAAGKIYLGLAALLWPAAMLYACEYMRHEKREGHFFSWYLTAYGAVVLLAAAKNLFTLYVFYELLTLCTVPLVWHGQDDPSHRAAVQYMLYLIGGAAVGLACVMLVPALGGGQGGFRMGGLETDAARQAGLWPLAALMGFVGFGAKAAVLPLSRWLPAASVAPTPVTALLHAVAVVNGGVFSICRLLYYIVPLDLLRDTWAQSAMLILSAATVVYGAVRAVREQHVKRRLAWSTVSNLSYMLLGLSLMTEAGMAAGLAHMIFHSLTKIILFFCAGAVLTQTGRTDVRQMQGLGKKMPVTFGAFALSGISLMGVPPMPGFVSKYSLITAALQKGGTLPFLGAVALLISAVLTCVYICTVAFPAFFMPLRLEQGEIEPRDPGACMKVSLAVCCLLLLAAVVFAGPVMDLLHGLAKGGMG